MGRNESSSAGSNRGNSGTRGSVVSMELPPQLGRYRVKEKLGGGGMGSVYLVENTELEREEALKVPHFGDGTGTGLLERFLREARSAAKVEHPNLCPIYDAGVQDGIYYLTMRYLKGKLLSDYSGQAQPTRKAVEIVTKLAQALETAHSKGVIHRDLKPSNIMMVAGLGPVVMDFGLAKQVQQVDTRLTQMGSMLGTPAYMPPEQVNGDLEQMGPVSDVYSLGVILFELLTGRLPFEGTVASIFGKILYLEAPLPSSIVPGLNPALDGICRKAMAKAVSDRYPSMKAFAAALIDYLRSIPATEGLGSLVPRSGDKTAILQAKTVAPSPRPAPRADLFQAQTVAPQPKGSLPLPSSGASKGRDSSGLVETVPPAWDEEDVEDGTGSGASFGANLVGAFYLMLVLVVFAGAGWVMYPVIKTRVQSSDLAQASRTSEPLKEATTAPPLKSSLPSPLPSKAAAPETSLVPERIRQPQPLVDDKRAPSAPSPRSADPSSKPESKVRSTGSARPTGFRTSPAGPADRAPSPAVKIPKPDPRPAPATAAPKPVDRKPAPKVKPDPATLRPLAAVKMEKAQRFMDEGNKKEALPIFEEVVKDFPGTYESGIAQMRIRSIKRSTDSGKPQSTPPHGGISPRG
jgi:serine/threonine protein kinase